MDSRRWDGNREGVRHAGPGREQPGPPIGYASDPNRPESQTSLWNSRRSWLGLANTLVEAIL